MNGWLIGLCVAVMLLWFRQLGAMRRWSKLMESMGAMTDMIAVAAGLPKEELEEGRKVWTQTRIKAAQQTAVTGLLVVMVTIFLVALMVRGKI